MSETEKTAQKSRWRHVPVIILAACALLILAIFFATSIWPIELVYHLVAGWLLHISRHIPKLLALLQGSAAGLVFAIIIGGVLLTGIHQLIVWWRKHSGWQRPWRKFHSFLLTLMILLGSGAAIALSGMAHELAWLPQEPFTQNNRNYEITVVLNDARQLGLIVLEYEAEHGTLPTRWSDLDELTDSLDRLIHVKTSATGPPERFLLLPSHGDDPQRPIIVSPVFPRSGKFIVVAADSSVKSHDARQWNQFVGSILSPATSDEP